MTTQVALAQKYFITGALIPAGMAGMFGRGRILGPVNDLSLHYLCELYGIDSSELTIRNQVVYSLDFLSRGDVYLYDDRELWELESRRVYQALKELQKRAEAARRKEAKERAALLKKAGISDLVIGADLTDVVDQLTRDVNDES